MALDIGAVYDCLNRHLVERLDEDRQRRKEDCAGPESHEECTGNPGVATSGLTNHLKRISHAMDVYQHRIWQLKDRLSCEVYGPSSQAMTDEILLKCNLKVDRNSQDYIRVLRKVLMTEIEYYSVLMEREKGDPDYESQTVVRARTGIKGGQR